MVSQKDLESLKSRLRGISQRGHSRFYHTKSVGNFVHHLASIQDSQEVIRMYDLLNSYLKILEETQIDSIHKSLELYNEYVQPIGEYYSDHYGFIIYTKPWIVLIITIIVIGISILISAGLIIYLMLLVALIAYFIYLGRKVRGRKVYAFLW